jgi:hypothetical protein
MKWLEDNEFPNINDFEVGFDPIHGHGLKTKKDIAEKDLILTVFTCSLVFHFYPYLFILISRFLQNL